MDWFNWTKSGGLAKVEVYDEDDEVFGVIDPTPLERTEVRTGLRRFLLDGQKLWKGDGGVKPKERVLEPEMKAVWTYVLKGRRRRPVGIIDLDMNVQEYIGAIFERVPTYNPKSRSENN